MSDTIRDMLGFTPPAPVQPIHISNDLERHSGRVQTTRARALGSRPLEHTTRQYNQKQQPRDPRDSTQSAEHPQAPNPKGHSHAQILVALLQHYNFEVLLRIHGRWAIRFHAVVKSTRALDTTVPWLWQRGCQPTRTCVACQSSIWRCPINTIGTCDLDPVNRDYGTSCTMVC